MDKKREYNFDDKIVFFAKEDLDLDGTVEVVIASGYMDVEPKSFVISQLYVLRDVNGVIQQVGKNLANSGYSTYTVKLIRLQNLQGKYIYNGLNNYANLVGFQVLKVNGNKLKEVFYSASITGLGDDGLSDSNKDGQFDGSVAYRRSYDVFYFPTVEYYKLIDERFIINWTAVELPKYPKTAKSVVLQYISLRALMVQKSKEVDKRIAELCKYKNAINFDYSYEDWFSHISNTIISAGEGLDFNIKKNGKNINVMVSFKNEEKKSFKNTFTLEKQRDKWVIIKIA